MGRAEKLRKIQWNLNQNEMYYVALILFSL
jgi:hypothetical protein